MATGAVIGLLLGGCSGAGTEIASVRGESYQAVAEDHMSAVVTFKGWANVLYQKVAITFAAPGVAPAACAMGWNQEFLPDMTLHLWGTTTDCSTVDYYIAMDQSGHGTVTMPDGASIDTVWTAPAIDPATFATSYHLTETYSDGRVLDYDYSIDPSAPGSPQTWDGTAALDGGQAMNFVLSRAQAIEDHLVAELPDGSRLDMRTPTAATLGAAYWPLFDQGAKGTFVGPSGRQLELVVAGSQQTEQWEQWGFTGQDGLSGQFGLAAGFAGSGRLERDGTVIAALNWTDPSAGAELDIVASGNADVSPSAASRAFQMDQWISTIAALGPAPLY